MDKAFESTLIGILVKYESRNISENIQCGGLWKFENGDVLRHIEILWDGCVDSEIVIVPE